ncbi:hypothetical protein ECQG_04463 [Escherichia coli TA255]|nr:hypothetical protein ECQG_04463 [Escherichia coli TA255]
MDWPGTQFHEHGTTCLVERALKHHWDAMSAVL